jgi:DNA gyrase subunit A
MSKADNKIEIAREIIPREVTDEMRESYLDYAMSVIVSRALPDVRDGLKPVHRRILYSLYEMGLKSSAATKKSSAIVGYCLGRYHPHSDTAVYYAMVGLAQDFSRRYPLVIGQGNFGSIDDDPPAASRYTEAKLSVLGEDMLSDIEKNTVDFADNYDGTFKEPMVLPSPVPQILLNGTIGIAVGMATSILPHNLSELCQALNYLIDHPEATTEDLFQFVKGPDLPTGGIIYGQGELVSTYSQGKGAVLNRGRAEIVEKERGSQIVITEIPYRVNKAALVSKIAHLVAEDKIKGVKSVRDESDRQGLRVVIEITAQGFPQRILNQLYRYTDLEKKHYINMVALVDGLQPRVLSLVDMLNYYLTHRREVVVRRAKFELERGLKRQHILEGLIIALAHIDEIIAVIKKSEDRADAARNLIKKFKLSEVQAEAILEIKLHRLAKLERVEIEQELKDIEKRVKEWRGLLASPQKVEKLIQQELASVDKKYGDKRRTEIISGEVKQISKKDLIPDQENFIIITQKGYIKRNQPEVYKIQKRGGRGIVGMKTIEGDIVEHFISVSTHDQLLFFTDTGKVYELPAYEIEEGSRVSRGRGLANYLPISSEERVLSVINQRTADNQRYLVMVTKKGMIKKTDRNEYQKIRKNGLQAIKLKKGDLLRSVVETSGSDQLMLITKKGKSILFLEKNIRATGRVTAGVKGISIGKDDEVIGLMVIGNKVDSKKVQILTLSEKGYGKRTALNNYRSQGRGGKGIIAAKINTKTGNLVFAKLIDNNEQDLIVISMKGNIIRTKVKDASVLGRSTSGVRIMRLGAGDKIASATCLLEEEDK